MLSDKREKRGKNKINLSKKKEVKKMEKQEEIGIKNLDHLGIVAGWIDELEIEKIIDQKLGKDSREKISAGKVVKALILNGLGMVSRPLYLFSQFWEDKAIEKLLGKGVKAEYLNDDKIGRVMDKIYELGTSNLFVEIALLAIKKFKIQTKYTHLDSTSFHLHGEYKNQKEKAEEEEEEVRKERPIWMGRGYSRDRRPDLKQCILDLVVSNDSAMPLFIRAADGNESDKAIFGKIAIEIKKQVKIESIIVSDSALYSQENIQLMKRMKWITRVPMTLKKAKETISIVEIEKIKEEDLEDLEEEERKRIKNLQERGYKWKEKRVNYGGVEQRWLIVESEKRKKSDRQLLETRIDKEKKQTKNLVKQLEKEKFEHPSQTQYQLKKLNQKLKFFQINEERIIKAKTKSQKIEYNLQVKIETKWAEIERKRQEAGRFILATNILDVRELTSAEILQNYQNQQGCERGFGFLKDPLFFADSFFVKKPERIETLLFLMSLCLLVYNLGQREIRNCLQRTEKMLKNQLGKCTNSPTLRWIFQCFQGLHVLTFSSLETIVNLTEERRFILEFLPSSCQRYYLLSPSSSLRN